MPPPPRSRALQRRSLSWSRNSAAKTRSAEASRPAAPSGWRHAPRPASRPAQRWMCSRSPACGSQTRDAARRCGDGAQPEGAGPALTSALVREVRKDPRRLDDTASPRRQHGDHAAAERIAAPRAAARRRERDPKRSTDSTQPPK